MSPGSRPGQARNPVVSLVLAGMRRMRRSSRSRPAGWPCGSAAASSPSTTSTWRSRRQRVRVPRAQRVGQDHHDPDAARPDPPHRRHVRLLGDRPAATGLDSCCRASGRWSRARRSTRSCPAAEPRQVRRRRPRPPTSAPAAARIDRRARPGGAAGRRRQALSRVLAGDEAAARHRGRAAAAA